MFIKCLLCASHYTEYILFLILRTTVWAKNSYPWPIQDKLFRDVQNDSKCEISKWWTWIPNQIYSDRPFSHVLMNERLLPRSEWVAHAVWLVLITSSSKWRRPLRVSARFSPVRETYCSGNQHQREGGAAVAGDDSLPVLFSLSVVIAVAATPAAFTGQGTSIKAGHGVLSTLADPCLPVLAARQDVNRRISEQEKRNFHSDSQESSRRDIDFLVTVTVTFCF